jgi:Ca2+-binding RTX toxin-like protein
MPRIRNTNGADTFFAFDSTSAVEFFIPPGSRGAGDDSVFGLDARDILHGGTGNDVLGGGLGFDELFGGAGNDFLDVGGFPSPSGDRNNLFGGDGDDRLQLEGGGLASGGDGSDTLIVRDGRATVDGGAGRDLLDLALDVNAILLVDLRKQSFITETPLGRVVISGIEDLTISGFTGEIIGSRKANSITGGDNGDTISGLRGKDVLDGGGGTDTIFGGAGADRIGQQTVGSVNTVDGGDIYFGGAGEDVFVFTFAKHSPVSNPDTIGDFRSGVDKIDLSFFVMSVSPFNAFTWEFIGSDDFTDGNQLQFRNGQLRGELANGPAESFAVDLTGITTLRESDLILM